MEGSRFFLSGIGTFSGAGLLSLISLLLWNVHCVPVRLAYIHSLSTYLRSFPSLGPLNILFCVSGPFFSLFLQAVPAHLWVSVYHFLKEAFLDHTIKITDL